MIHAGSWLILSSLCAYAVTAQASYTQTALLTQGTGLVWDYSESAPCYQLAGYYHEQAEESRLPSIIVLDTTIAGEPGQIALFDTSTLYFHSPVLVAPHRTVTLLDLPITGAVQQQTLGDTQDGGLEYQEWFPFFQLQGNGTLILQDLVVHMNPTSPNQASLALALTG